MKKIFVAWQDPNGRAWFPIGQLAYDGHYYVFSYTRGAQLAKEKAGFEPLLSFPLMEEAYYSKELFPLFQNRIPPRSRPEFADFVQWVGLADDATEPLAILAKTGGRRKTDALEVFPCPEQEPGGWYRMHFFVHGLRHFPSECAERVLHLQPNEELLLMRDFQNPHDDFALMLRTSDSFDRDRYLVGFCPRYLSKDVLDLVGQCLELLSITVARVNPPPCPLQFRLLCELRACWPLEWEACSREEYQPIVAGIEA